MARLDEEIHELVAQVNDLPFDVNLYYIEESKEKYAFIDRYKYYIRALRQVESDHIADLGALRDDVAKFERMKIGQVYKIEKMNERIRNRNKNNASPRPVDTGPLEKRRDEAVAQLRVLIGKLNHVKSEKAVVIQAMKKVISAKRALKKIYQRFQTGLDPQDLGRDGNEESHPPTVMASIIYRNALDNIAED